jgi:hypothetical protein
VLDLLAACANERRDGARASCAAPRGVRCLALAERFEREPGVGRRDDARGAVSPAASACFSSRSVDDVRDGLAIDRALLELDDVLVQVVYGLLQIVDRLRRARRRARSLLGVPFRGGLGGLSERPRHLGELAGRRAV